MKKKKFKHGDESLKKISLGATKKKSGYWDADKIYFELKEVITNYYSETNIIPVLSVINNELIPGIYDPIRRLHGDAMKFYLKFLEDNGFPNPDDCLFKDGVLFRGHYEYVGYCFVKAWNINVIPVKKMDKYYSDGYFVDIDTYWEHWGGLNKNNSIKKKLYKKNKLNLFETYDAECTKHGKGYEYLYNTMRDFFINKGYDIPEYNRNELYSLLKKEVITFENTLNWIIETLKSEPTLHKHLTTKKLCKFDFGQRFISFFSKHFNGITNFKEYLNEHYGFNYPIERHVDRYYYLSEENLFRELTPIVKKYGRLPSRLELEVNGRRDIDRFIKKQFGGFKDMRRNEIYIGKYFHIIDDMLDGNAPWDLKIDWNEESIKKIIEYYKSKNIDLPYYLKDLYLDERYGKLGKQLHDVIVDKKLSVGVNINNWTDFKRMYDGYVGEEIPEKPKFVSYNECVLFFKNIGIKKQKEWHEWCKKNVRPDNIPFSPQTVYKRTNEWISWGDFLDTGVIHPKDKKFLPYNEARDFVRGLNLKNAIEWRKYSASAKRPANITASPQSHYARTNEWINWADFLGTENVNNKNKFTQDFLEEIKGLLKAGVSQTEIRKKYKIGRPKLCKLNKEIKRLDLQLKTNNPTPLYGEGYL